MNSDLMDDLANLAFIQDMLFLLKLESRRRRREDDPTVGKFANISTFIIYLTMNDST